MTVTGTIGRRLPEGAFSDLVGCGTIIRLTDVLQAQPLPIVLIGQVGSEKMRNNKVILVSGNPGESLRWSEMVGTNSNEHLAAELKFALLIDGDNVSGDNAKLIMDEASVFGMITIRNVYGNWMDNNLIKWRGAVTEHSLTPLSGDPECFGKKRYGFRISHRRNGYPLPGECRWIHTCLLGQRLYCTGEASESIRKTRYRYGQQSDTSFLQEFLYEVHHARFE